MCIDYDNVIHLDQLIELETLRLMRELDVHEFDVERDFEHIELDANGERRTRIDNNAEG